MRVKPENSCCILGTWSSTVTVQSAGFLTSSDLRNLSFLRVFSLTHLRAEQQWLNRSASCEELLECWVSSVYQRRCYVPLTLYSFSWCRFIHAFLLFSSGLICSTGLLDNVHVNLSSLLFFSLCFSSFCVFNIVEKELWWDEEIQGGETFVVF